MTAVFFSPKELMIHTSGFHIYKLILIFVKEILSTKVSLISVTFFQKAPFEEIKKGMASSNKNIKKTTIKYT